MDERFDYILKLCYRARPTVHHKQWQWIVTASLLMDEMDIDHLSVRSCKRYRELGEGVDPCFCRTPIKLVLPIRDEPPHVVEV